MGEVPRERFVPTAKRARSPMRTCRWSVYRAGSCWIRGHSPSFSCLPTSSRKTSSLDVGSATGYSAAVLARLGRTVIALEQDAEMVRVAYDMLPSPRRRERDRQPRAPSTRA